MLVKSNGSKIWRFQYSFEGKRYLSSFGAYPTVTLVAAREKRAVYQQDISNGINPNAEKKKTKQAESKESQSQFHLVAYGWLDMIEGKNDKSTHAKRVRAFERDIFPYFCQYDNEHKITASKNISEITHSELLIANISKKDALQKHEKKHYPKVTDEKILGELLRSIDSYKASKITREALRLLCFLPLRAENIFTLTWERVDFEKEIITIPRAEMKVKDKNVPDFVIPLSLQAISVLQDIKQITGWGLWVFCGHQNMHRHISLETCNKALRLMGLQ